MAQPIAPAEHTDQACSDVAEALDGDLGWALGVVFRSYVKLAGIAVDNLPGGPRGYQILAAAARSVPGTQLAIAQQLGVDRTVMTYLLDDLVTAGLIERQPDPADRRARRIVATEHGRATLAGLQSRLKLAEEHVLAGLPEADRTAFRDLLRRLASQVDAKDPMTNPCQAVHETGLAEPPAPTARARSRRR
jgi:DNA-binding MarR family transcriptional regulator